jgi:hypothetical protein
VLQGQVDQSRATRRLRQDQEPARQTT